MSCFRDAVTCTVHDGELLMHLNNGCVKIPSLLLNKSQVFKDALSLAHPSTTRQVTLAAPDKWLQAWAACYCNEEEKLNCAEIEDLVNCLLVCSVRCNAAAVVLDIGVCAVAVFTACRMIGSATLFHDLKVTPLWQLLDAEVSEPLSKIWTRMKHRVVIAGS
jgi:hypothetical protein